MKKKPVKKPKESKARKTSQTPTKVFKYGALAPITSLTELSKFGLRHTSQPDILRETVFNGFLYRNALVEIEQQRRKASGEIFQKISPDLVAYYKAIAELGVKIEDGYDRLSKVRDPARPEFCITRAERANSPEAQAIMEAIKDLKTQRVPIWEQVKAKTEALRKTHLKDGADAFGKARIIESLKYLAKNHTDADIRAKAGQLLVRPADESLEDLAAHVKAALGKKAESLAGARTLEKINAAATKRLLADTSLSEVWRQKHKIDTDASTAQKKARQASALLSGTYMKVETAAQQSFGTAAWPSRVRFDRRGALGIQLTTPVSWETALACSSNKLQIRFDESAYLHGNGNSTAFVASLPDATIEEVSAAAAKIGMRLHPKHVAEIRNNILTGKVKAPQYRRSALVSIGIGVRTKQYLHVPIVMHRPMPKDAHINWVYLFVKRVGTRQVLDVQFTIESNEFEARPVPTEKSSTIAVTLGWRVLDNGDIRIATAWDGQKILPPVLLPAKLRTHQQFSEELLGTSDNHFDNLKKVVGPWLKAQTDVSWASAKLIAKLGSFHQWRDHGRMANLVRDLGAKHVPPDMLRNLWERWRIERLSKKEDLFGHCETRDNPDANYLAIDRWLKGQKVSDPTVRMALFLEWWRRKDEHLVNWARNIQAHVRASRREIYRVAAASWASTYEHVVVQEWDMSATAKSPSPERDTRQRQQENAASVRQFAGPSRFREAILGAFGKDRVSSEDSENITQEHFACGGRIDNSLRHQDVLCQKCERIFDQDANACRHLWQRHHDRTSPESLAAE